MKYAAALLALLMLFCAPALAEDGMVETVLYNGTASVSSSWQLITGVNTTNSNGPFDPSLITEGGYFIVEYTGTPGEVYLALSEWQDGVWAQSDAPASCEKVGDRLQAKFTFEQCSTAYKGTDFSGVDQVCVGSANATEATIVYKITWYGHPVEDDLGATATLFRGSATASQANANMAYVFTKHVGGEFDAAQINPGSYFYVEYSGKKNGIYLAFSSHSGGTQWKRVDADATVEYENNRFVAYFDYDNFSKVWGNNFARLDQLSVFTTTADKITLHRIAYFTGTGAPVDTSDGRWDRPDTGIAFIGDSICQNALLIYGDWNKILGRTDCVNYGIGAQTTVECLARIDELASRQYSKVVFICGINDIGRGRTSEEIVANFDGMIQAIRAKNPECEFIFVSVLPTTSAFYRGQQDKIVNLNKAYEDYAAKNDGVTFVDVYSSFTSAAGEYAYAELLSDGLHPNQAGYAKMAEILNPYLAAE